MPVPSLATFLFDLDGTLIDSVELIRRSFRHTLETHRSAHPGEDRWLAGLGQPLWDQFRMYTSDQAEIDAMIATYRQYNFEHHDTLVRAYPGMDAVIRELKGRGRRLGVVTSKMQRGTRQGLALCGMEGLFDTIVAADDTTKHKPNPEPVWLALERLEAGAETAVFVGDSTHDLAAGRAAGVKTAAALWGPFGRELLAPHQPDHWLETPEQILDL
jgi:pyrophosphatase PpaX